MTVEKFLELCAYEDNVVVCFRAYGQPYANSYYDGMETVEDLVENLTYDCRKARVIGLHPFMMKNAPYVRVIAEMVK